ncbi:N-6 DNA methylase [Aliifodinibius sp. S!AR15-10]|uniref:type ISP restriction/modification enzyme n=1 Tax=Aliifodinibius sp. S!AR15-10 TaxID=2950437 RepID=UPI00285E0CC9|nr:type ISP restriction/modification enzyme [Aliifodinibius sp. S!AR15-10]MDR8394073.1 N-6 DNA methylase [Aliifodinibius sp. S!AR15-10]
MIESFVGDIAKKMHQGDAREETYYGVFERFLEQFSHQLDARDATVTALPKRTEAGNPDFRVWDGSHKVIGYIEAKKPGENLDKIQRSEQLKRYRSTFPNVILTDFFEYRLYKDGDLVDKVSIGRPFVAEKLGEQPPVENEEAFTKLVETFLSHSAPKTYHASSLAKELAKRTRFLEHVIERELLDEGNQKLEGFFQAFQKYLIAGLNKQQFADLYSQTVTYGLFAARTRADETFTRENAIRFIPSTIGILKDVFQFISYSDLPQNISWIVDDLSEILNVADIQKILNRFYEEGRGNDPIIHFYETFLAKYNPKVREQRGVYYTPEPVVDYIVRSVHQTLKDDFDKPLGLADKSVTVLDPAAGTLTFIAEALRVAVEEYKEHYGSGDISGLIKEHLLEHFYAFELMMAPYAIGHLKMGFVLDEFGYEMSDDERFKLYLTNTLEMEDLEQTELPGMHSLSEESEAAGKVKKDEEVLVILGNPPYSGNSFNDNDWIDNLLKEGYTHENGHKDDGYYKVDGKPLGERNPKMLQDDYVKFIRFAQWKIDQLGHGVVSMITNHGYLDNPTFRGMRESLIKSFDEIAVLDLHGNYRKKETAPDGSKDENVFDIQQGVAIHSMIKRADKPKNVLRGDLYGKRSEKYDWLEKHGLRNTEWTEITPQSEFYFFTELDYDLRERYRQFIQVTDLFDEYASGLTTHRDNFVLDFDLAKLKTRIKTFARSNESDEWLKQRYRLTETKAWKVSEARNDLDEVDLEQFFQLLLYRPFDKRHIFYHEAVVDRGREEIMRHMLAGDNLGLLTPRQFKEEPCAFITEDLTAHKSVSAYDRNYLFPLYLYPETDTNGEQKDGNTMALVFEDDVKYTERRPNLNKEFYKLLEHNYGERPAPEQVLYYNYGVLYASAYRQTYAEFLKSDFPRIPFTTDYELFRDLASLGEQLGSLHLMKSDKLNTPIAKFEGEGSKVVAKEKRIGRNYQPEEARVYINKDGQYFEGISEEVWNYQVGGYQVLDKYLYDRRERKLTNDEIQHYCKVATAIYHTIELQKEIDEVYAGVEEDIIEWDPSG